MSLSELYIFFSSIRYTGTPAMNWDDAEKNCVQNGAHLVSIHSEEENKFVLDLWRKSRDENTWFEVRFIFVMIT